MSDTGILAREFEMGGTTFQIGKLGPIEAKQLFMHHVRPLLRGALSAKTGADAGEAGQWQMILAAFTDAPIEHYEAIVAKLYQQIVYRPKGEAQFMPLAGDAENAFKDLDMAHSLMLDARAFAVNFFGSWGVILSELKSLAPNFDPSKLRT